MNKTLLKVKGMKCGGCSNNIEQALKANEGVISVKASHVEGSVEIEYAEEKTDLQTLKQTIIGLGFSFG